MKWRRRAGEVEEAGVDGNMLHVSRHTALLEEPPGALFTAFSNLCKAGSGSSQRAGEGLLTYIPREC